MYLCLRMRGYRNKSVFFFNSNLSVSFFCSALHGCLHINTLNTRLDISDGLPVYFQSNCVFVDQLNLSCNANSVSEASSLSRSQYPVLKVISHRRFMIFLLKDCGLHFLNIPIRHIWWSEVNAHKNDGIYYSFIFSYSVIIQDNEILSDND